MKSDTMIKIVCSALCLAIVVLVGNAIYSVEKEFLETLPKGAFTIIKKEVRQGWTWFIPYPIYVFYYDNSHCIEVHESDYNKYNVGDLYPNEYTILH